MHSLISKKGECVGHYLQIENTPYCIKMFTNIYNSVIGDSKFFIDSNIARDIILMSKYNINNNIYANDPTTDDIILKSVNVGDYIVYMIKSTKLYIFNDKELEDFIKKYNYEKEPSTNYILAEQKNDIFINPSIIYANNIHNAKKIYKEKYNAEPTFLAIEDNHYLYIPTDKDVLVTKIIENEDILNQKV